MGPKKYRKMVEAVQWTGENEEEVRRLAGFRVLKISSERMNYLLLWNMTGDYIADPGDFIVKAADDTLYPCKPDIFRSMYEECNNGTTDN